MPAPDRIVSLVPSLTETLCSFGLGRHLVGRTRYCSEPSDEVEGVETVGGTKNPEVARIVELAPDLVLLNREENRREDYEALREAGLRIHVTHPRSVLEAAPMLRVLGEVVGRVREGADLAQRCERAAAVALREAASREEVLTGFCPIWRNPWMTFHAGTYVGDVLRTVGLANVFAQAKNRGGDFFAVTLDEIRTAAPRVVLLPDEPYMFFEKHARELEDSGVEATFVLIDGKDLSWYGPRLPAALGRLCARLAEIPC